MQPICGGCYSLVPRHDRIWMLEGVMGMDVCIRKRSHFSRDWPCTAKDDLRLTASGCVGIDYGDPFRLQKVASLPSRIYFTAGEENSVRSAVPF